MTTLWRCCKRKYLATAFSGDGGRHSDGRWHTEGRRVIYTSDEASLSLLEIMVNGWNLEQALQVFALISCNLAEKHIHTFEEGELPDGWDSPQPTGGTQAWGDNWLEKGEYAALRVPSSVMPGTNVLINPVHPLAVDLVPAPEHVEWDPRLTRVQH